MGDAIARWALAHGVSWSQYFRSPNKPAPFRKAWIGTVPAASQFFPIGEHVAGHNT